MKSSQLKFANPHLNNIDFEIIPNSATDRFLGLVCVAGIVVTILVFLVVLEALPDRSGMLGPYITAFMIFVVLKLLRLSRKYLHNSMSIVKDARAPIVYLRSFSDDHEDDDKRWDHRTSEELITLALKRVGPVLAVKDQRQEHKFLGATRIAMGENWRVEIEKLISISQLVIVEANYTENLLWELQLIKRLLRPEQLIISFLSRDEYHESEASIRQLMDQGRDTESHYEKFHDAFAQIFGVSLQPYRSDRLCFFYFDNAWRAKPVTLELAATPFRRLSLLIYIPFIFTSRYKRHLPFWKIKRALMLILHNNGIVAQTKYVKEIEAERRRIETARNHPAWNSDPEPQFGTGGLSLLAINSRPINNEAQSISESKPAQSLLLKIDSFKPHKKHFLLLGAAVGIAVIGIGGLVLLNLGSIRAQSYLEKGVNCAARRSAQCAIENCTRAIELDPTIAQAYRCLGNSHSNSEDYQQAIGEYNKALELDPTFGDAYYNRAACYFNLQDYDHAISDATLAKERDPKRAIYFSLSGRAYLGKHDYENALRELRRAVQLDRKNASSFYDLSLAQEALAKPDDAISSITSAIVLDPMNPSYYANRAGLYFSEKEYDLSISDYDRAIGLGTDLLELFYSRGLAYCLRKSSSKIDDYRRAIEDFTSVIAIDSSYRNAYWNRSFAHNKLGEKKQAESDFKTCQRLDRLGKK